jgi:glycosyltransferase involved in cell wall biosynthesis
MRLLFVVHRYYPFPGGSEYYVQAMAEEALSRGHEVSVISGEHQGDQNGVKVSSNADWLLQPWDLIIVHGADVQVQNFVLSNAKNIPSPILYMLILPSGSAASLQAMNDCKYVGWSTNEDLDYINKHGVSNKAVNIRHGIKHQDSIGVPGFKTKYNITGPMFLSCGGYWPNKAMKELANLFKNPSLQDAVLVTTGYDNRNDLMPELSANVIPLMIEDKTDVLSAISEADCYVMHSFIEGFGLVLLESMLNSTPWIARHGSGAALLKAWGKTYTTDDQLSELLINFDRSQWDVDGARNHVLSNHLISNTVDDIERVAIDSISTTNK